MADKSTSIVALLGACGTQSQGLWPRAIGIDDIEVVDLGCSGIVPQGSWCGQQVLRIVREDNAHQTHHFPLPSQCCG